MSQLCYYYINPQKSMFYTYSLRGARTLVYNDENIMSLPLDDKALIFIKKSSASIALASAGYKTATLLLC